MLRDVSRKLGRNPPPPPAPHPAQERGMPWKELSEPTDDDKRELDFQYRGKARFLVDESPIDSFS